MISFLFHLIAELTQFKLLKLRADVSILPVESATKGSVSLKASCLMAQDSLHMGPEGVRTRKKTPIFFFDAKLSQIARGFQKCKS